MREPLHESEHTGLSLQLSCLLASLYSTSGRFELFTIVFLNFVYGQEHRATICTFARQDNPIRVHHPQILSRVSLPSLTKPDQMCAATQVQTHTK